MIVLPALSADLRIDTGAGSLVIALFPLAFAASLVLGARLGDRYGRRRLFRVGLAGLAASSVLVALTSSLAPLLVARVLQGAAAGLLLPQALATVQHTTTGRRRARWLGVYAGVLGIGTTAGQLLGGAFTSSPLGDAGWRQVFTTIAALSLAVLAATAFVPETRSGSASRTDLPGAVLLGLGLTAVLLTLSVGREAGWPWWAFVLLAAAAALLGAFALWERRIDPRRALLPPATLGQPALLVGLCLAGIFFSGYGAFVYLFVLAAENGMGLSSLTTALTLLPFAIGFVVTSLVLPRLPTRRTPRRVMRRGAIAQSMLLIAIGLTVFAGWPSPSPWLLQPLMVLLGAAQSLVYTPLIGLVLDTVPVVLAGVASGLLSTVQQLATALGVAAFALLSASLSASPAGAFLVCLCVQSAMAMLSLVTTWALRPGAERGGVAGD